MSKENLKKALDGAPADSATPREAVLDLLVAGGPGRLFNSVHVQIMLFLLDEKRKQEGTEPLFEFVRSKYGVYDQNSVDELDILVGEKYAECVPGSFPGRRLYLLVAKGFEAAEAKPGMAAFVDAVLDFNGGYLSLLPAVYELFPAEPAK